MSLRTALCAALAGGVLVAAPAGAQDNPVPLNYRGLVVTVHSVQNNRNEIVTGAKVTVTAEKPDPRNHVRFPLVRTSQRNGARFPKLPPSNVVGAYTITVEHAPCGEPLTQTRRLGGGSDARVAFRFGPCGTSRDVAQAADRRGQGQSFDLTLKVPDPSNRRLISWVHLKQNGRSVTKRRGTFHGDQLKLTFQNVVPGSYAVEVPMGRDKRSYDVEVQAGGTETLTIE